MSLVGTRPILQDELRQYELHHRARIAIKPGIDIDEHGVSIYPFALLDVSKATNLGWTYKTELEDGIRLAYEDFLNNPMRAER